MSELSSESHEASVILWWQRLIFWFRNRRDHRLDATLKHYARLELTRGVEQSCIDWDVMKKEIKRAGESSATPPTVLSRSRTGL